MAKNKRVTMKPRVSEATAKKLAEAEAKSKLKSAEANKNVDR